MPAYGKERLDEEEEKSKAKKRVSKEISMEDIKTTFSTLMTINDMSACAVFAIIGNAPLLSILTIGGILFFRGAAWFINIAKIERVITHSVTPLMLANALVKLIILSLG